MRGRSATGGLRGGAEISLSGAQELNGLIRPFRDERVRFSLMPFEAAFFAVHADVEIVFLANADLGGVQNSFGAVVETEEDVDVVIEDAAFDEGGDVGSEFFDFYAGDVFGKIFGVRADVADAAPCSALFGVGAPEGLFLAEDFKARGKPALWVFDNDFADLADFAGLDHVARFFDERVAGVVVSERVEQASFFDEVAKLFGLLEIEGRGFVAENMEAVFESHLRRREMHVVRRDDGNEVHALVLGQLGLGLDHFLERAVTTIRRQEKVCAAGFAFFGVARKRSAN